MNHVHSRRQRRTIRVRLTALYFAVFLASGAALLGITSAVWQGRTGGASQTVSAVPEPSSGAQRPSIVVTQHTSDWHQLLVAGAIGLAIMAAVSLALGWLLAGRFLRPLRTITATTRRISATNLHERLSLAGPDDELAELAGTFNELLDRLERSFAFERRFVANASHELRTPLAGMRASLDVAMGKPGPAPAHLDVLADRLRRELDHADRLLASFLTLAQTQQGPPTDESTVSLAELARAAIERRADAIAQLGLDVRQERCAQAPVTGSQTLLARMVENAIDNAIGHNQPGGWVRVITEAGEHQARLIVENGGALLRPDEVGRLTEPFRRIGAERTGSGNGAGLGLAIIASIAEVHGGTLDLEALGAGGLRVAIMLPVAVSAPVGGPA
ncbi:MAG TPA: HAMP domain-containing sensor histidine kinase [Solirubrobacteraceae bacterium]|nr:HAMP domain-containing sensor histidine kinase [Solirubrobacteraceae bacterium]